jgi:hypothetical protein
MNKGEANIGRNAYRYTCSFAKMIQYWRQTWNERTNGITDIQFPFGFVQVSFTRNHLIRVHTQSDEVKSILFVVINIYEQ